ncbi:MATE family efflux transporter [Bradyrhizobium neotropicale]|uniref:MATE family efflux transporter n=1 Tax=Bradyrhizobium TaxID=374 RepID=UPI0007C5A085|nr:MATE family efflux transporter [Bradyrhizobium neotropicale]
MHEIVHKKPLSASQPRHGLAVELGQTAKLAWPMALTQLAQVAMMATDLAFIGRIGPEALAAAALGVTLYIISCTFGAGLLAPIGPLTAQAIGAANFAVVPRALRMGLWLALFLSVPIIAIAVRGEQILLALGQGPDAARLAQQYLLGLAWGVVPALWLHAIRNFMAAAGRPEPILWITLAAIPVNAVLVYLLVFGKFGLPRLELFGVGLGSTLVNCGTFLAAVCVATMCRPFRDYRVLAHVWRFDRLFMRQMIVIGTPISIALVMQYGVFAAGALLAGRIGTSALAAHQIAMQVATILYTVPLGISMAAAVRVGHAVGRKDGPSIKRAGLAAIVLGFLIAALLTIGVVAARFQIAELFLDKSAADADATIGLATTLLLVTAGFFAADATQIIAAGGLRGLKDTRMPLLFAVLAYWLIGFSFSYAFGLMMGLGAIGIWIGLSVGSATYAGLLVIRFQLLATRFSVLAPPPDRVNHRYSTGTNSQTRAT